MQLYCDPAKNFNFFTAQHSGNRQINKTLYYIISSISFVQELWLQYTNLVEESYA